MTTARVYPIIYGNPSLEETPLLSYRKNYPTGGGLVTVDAELVRQITVTDTFAANLIESAQRLTKADALVAKGKNYGTGWELAESIPIPSDSGLSAFRLRYVKRNVSPLEYGNPAALSIALSDSAGTVLWNGQTAITYQSPTAREGFQLVEGAWTSVAGYVFPIADHVHTGGGMDGLNPYEYRSGAMQSSQIGARAYDLTLGGVTVAQAANPKVVRYGFSYYAPVGFEGAPRRIVEWVGGQEDSEAAARYAGESYYTTFKADIQAKAAAAAAIVQGGGVVLGYTAVDDGGVYTRKTLESPSGDKWGFGVWLKATENYILASTLATQNSRVDPDRYYSSAASYSPPEYVPSGWTVDTQTNTATCTVGGGVLLTIPFASGGAA